MDIHGGERLEALLNDIAREIGKGGAVRIGFLENATYPDGKKVAMIAAIQEFGAPAVNIPPRPFFRNMIAEKSQEWPDGLAKNLKANAYNLDKSLGQVGEAISGQLRESIINTNSPPLAPATVKAKGFDKPLVDTGHMLNSIDYEVVK